MSVGIDTTITTTERPKAIGPVPPFLTRQIESVPAPVLPEFARLPRPGERDPISNASRSWLIETSDALPLEERFLFRFRQRGKARGVVFINVAKLLALLRRAETEDLHSAGNTQLTIRNESADGKQPTSQRRKKELAAA